MLREGRAEEGETGKKPEMPRAERQVAAALELFLVLAECAPQICQKALPQRGGTRDRGRQRHQLTWHVRLQKNMSKTEKFCGLSAEKSASIPVLLKYFFMLSKSF